MVAQQQTTSPGESQAGSAEARQQENLPLAPAKNLEVVTGSVVISSHFRSIRLPAELRSLTSRLGDSLQIGQRISSDQTAYPADALEQRIEGTVKLHAIIDRDGAVQSVEAVSGPATLVSEAMTAVRGWRYNRSLLGDQAVEREEDITFVFRLRTQTAAPN
jgi:TonB family protein